MKKKLIAIAASALCLVASLPTSTVLADGQKVVTLGADLTDAQKQAVLRYFGVAGQSIQTLTITNQDERNHLGSYVPLEQIGTKTFSCALVSPTNAGGIQVKTANLSWVTSNMIATTLSTSGVVNCDVLAAAPFEVSGTGALTGILMAYESAVGTQLDETKKEVATQELVTTTTIAQNIGQVNATEIVNESKIQVIQAEEVTYNDIEIIVNEVADEQGISLSDEDRELLYMLLDEIARQDYDYEEMKTTLERVESNLETIEQQLEGEVAEVIPAEVEDIPAEEMLSEDSILMNTDDSALGEGVTFDATDESALVETEAPTYDNSDIFEIVTSDDYSDGFEDPDVTPGEFVPTEDPEDPFADTDVVEDPNGEFEVIPEAQPSDAAEDEFAYIPVSTFKFGPITNEQNQNQKVPAGTNILTVSIPRSDVTSGSGMLTVYNADSSIFETVTLSDMSKVSYSNLDAEELMNNGWTEGTKATIYLSNPLAQSSNYFVILSEDAFMTYDSTMHSEAIPDSNTWNITTDEVGITVNIPVSGIYAGTSVTGQIVMDFSNAAYAVIENADEFALSFSTVEFYGTETFSIDCYQSGKTTFDVSFYNGEGSWIATYTYTLNIQ